jgi:serine/threonine-protein kinase
MKLQPGTEVTPNVRLESRIATGAMGSVWLAEHLTLNTKVAVKFISDRIDSDDPEVIERFVREASTAAQIKSSHVVQTFDQGVMRDGVPYIVMEYLEGEGLGERLQSGGPLPIPQVQRIIAQTAKALASAHKLGIVHRDIKPDNIFLSTHDDELHIKVFDFGIAKHRREASRNTMSPDGIPGDAQPELGLTNDGVMIGTPEYMSPEQVMSAASVDHHADLWGLSVCAYVSLTGKLPFTGADVGELCVNLLEASFLPPSQHRPELPPTVDAFFAKALARDPKDRYQSARELALAFQQAFPASSQPDNALISGPYQMRASTPSIIEVEDSQRGIRGIRGATFSGTEADAIRSRRLSPSAIGLLAAGLVLVGIVLVVTLGGSGGDPESSARQPVTHPVPAKKPSEAERADAKDAQAEPSAVASTSGSSAPASSSASKASATPAVKTPVVRPGTPGWPPARAPKPKKREPGF